MSGDGLTRVELELIAAMLDRGVSKGEAVREILALRRRREGSRVHGSSTGRAPRTRPLRRVDRILEDGDR